MDTLQSPPVPPETEGILISTTYLIEMQLPFKQVIPALYFKIPVFEDPSNIVVYEFANPFEARKALIQLNEVKS